MQKAFRADQENKVVTHDDENLTTELQTCEARIEHLHIFIDMFIGISIDILIDMFIDIFNEEWRRRKEWISS